jgi:fatty-acyl-CoA synthase
MGDLYVRGPWVVESYLHGDGADAFTEDGWFRTGDVAIGSPDGYFVIADRTKDLIKSGGEWISSVDMEAAIMAMADVAEAAVIAIPDDKWQERPMACVVPKPGATVTVESVHIHLQERGFAKWQLPDRVEIIDEVPKTGVGKFDKKVLRVRFS